MSASKTNKVAKDKAIGDHLTDPQAEVSQLRTRLEEHEKRHMTIKAEFEALKTLNQELSVKHDKHVKELKLDLRIAKRDAEKLQDSNRYLREQKKELSTKVSELQTSTDQMKEQMKSKDEQIQELFKQIESLNRELASKSSDQKVWQTLIILLRWTWLLNRRLFASRLMTGSDVLTTRQRLATTFVQWI